MGNNLTVSTDGNPSANRHNDLIIRAFQKLWLAGAAGAFFSALARGIATDVLGSTDPTRFNAGYTVVLVMRYFYLIWFLIYFFAVRFQVEDLAKPQRWKDAIFDVFQSVLALISIIYLGFVISVDKCGWQWEPYLFVNASIFGISAVSFWSFSNTEDPDHTRIRKVRIAGCAVSALGFGIAFYHWFHGDGLYPLPWFSFCLSPALLALLLAIYVLFRVFKPSQSIPDASGARLGALLESLCDQLNADLGDIEKKKENLGAFLTKYQTVLTGAQTKLADIKPLADTPAAQVSAGN
jgi:hypothetical protein